MRQFKGVDLAKRRYRKVGSRIQSSQSEGVKEAVVGAHVDHAIHDSGGREIHPTPGGVAPKLSAAHGVEGVDAVVERPEINHVIGDGGEEVIGPPVV